VPAGGFAVVVALLVAVLEALGVAFALDLRVFGDEAGDRFAAFQGDGQLPGRRIEGRDRARFFHRGQMSL
jgi:hypothetical protein